MRLTSSTRRDFLPKKQSTSVCDSTVQTTTNSNSKQNNILHLIPPIYDSIVQSTANSTSKQNNIPDLTPPTLTPTNPTISNPAHVIDKLKKNI